MMISFLFTLLISFNSQASCTNEEFAKKIAKGLPSGTEDLLSRITSCNHFAGEDPYDKERADFIDESVKRLKCAEIEKDKELLLKKNPKKQIKLKKAFESAENWDTGSCT